MTTKRELLEAVLGDRKFMRTVIQEAIKQIKVDETKATKRAAKKVKDNGCLMNMSLIVLENESYPLTPERLKSLVSTDTDIPMLFKALGSTEETLKLLLGLLKCKDVVRVALYAAKAVQHLVSRKATKATKAAIELVELWLLDSSKVTKEQLRAAADSAVAYADAYADANAACAAPDAAYAAYAAADADAATWAADAAYNAAYAAGGAKIEMYEKIIEYGVTLVKI